MEVGRTTQILIDDCPITADYPGHIVNPHQAQDVFLMVELRKE